MKKTRSGFSLPMLIDTHAHLDYPDFAADFDDVLARATEAGVTRIITIGTSLASSRRAVELAEKYPNVFAVIGVHPNYAEEAGDDVITPLRELAKSRRVAAIGETGLDYHRSAECGSRERTQNAGHFTRAAGRDRRRDRERNSRWRAQEQTGEPLSAATRSCGRAQAECRHSSARCLGRYSRNHARLRPHCSGVFHCFGGTREQAEEVIALGHLVSFTGIVTFKNGASVRDVAAGLSLGEFMVETDCPYLAPAPFRGKRCEPAHTRLVAESIAAARGVSLEELAGATTRTAEEFFRLNGDMSWRSPLPTLSLRSR